VIAKKDLIASDVIGGHNESTDDDVELDKFGFDNLNITESSTTDERISSLLLNISNID